jgi:hypothetical protein
MRFLMLAVALALPASAAAHPHNAGECREGGDFIRNAALSRDAGYSRAFFLGRLEQDFVAIRAFPPALRWFVLDQDDEKFLRAEVEAVFDAPQSSEEHRASFLQRCIRRSEDLTALRG